MNAWFVGIRKPSIVTEHINRLKKKNYMVMSIDREKMFSRIHHLLINHVLSKLEMEQLMTGV